MQAMRLRLPQETLRDTRGFAKRSSSFFIVRTRNNDLGHPRFAVVVAAKVDRRSTVRHALKRRISEHLCRRRDGRDLVVTVLPQAASLSRKIFMDEFRKVLPAEINSL